MTLNIYYFKLSLILYMLHYPRDENNYKVREANKQTNYEENNYYHDK